MESIEKTFPNFEAMKDKFDEVGYGDFVDWEHLSKEIEKKGKTRFSRDFGQILNNPLLSRDIFFDIDVTNAFGGAGEGKVIGKSNEEVVLEISADPLNRIANFETETTPLSSEKVREMIDETLTEAKLVKFKATHKTEKDSERAGCGLLVNNKVHLIGVYESDHHFTRFDGTKPEKRFHFYSERHDLDIDFGSVEPISIEETIKTRMFRPEHPVEKVAAEQCLLAEIRATVARANGAKEPTFREVQEGKRKISPYTIATRTLEEIRGFSYSK